VGESERVLGVIEYKSRYNHFPLTPQNSTAQPSYHSDQYTIVIVYYFRHYIAAVSVFSIINAVLRCYMIGFYKEKY